MTALGMGMSSYPPGLGMERGQPDDLGQGFGRRGESWRGEDWHGREERGLLDRAGDEVASWRLEPADLVRALGGEAP